MSLNIKNEKVHDLAREAAKRAGKSQTSVIEDALRRYLADLDRETRRQRADEIVAEMQRSWRESDAPPFTAEDLYDPVTGLPA
ncbi:MAG: type II toxin-antitoxin system VapB family antitoxin [Jatrophihabitans sp.]